MGLLDDHVALVAESIATGEGDEKIEELMAAVGRSAGKSRRRPSSSSTSRG